LKSLDRYLQDIVGSDLPGAVGVAVGPGLRWEGGAGVADLETGALMTPDHRFRVGSVMKLFTASLVLRLVGEGSLDLDDDAGPMAEGVTIRQLLNHTSGLPNFSDGDDLVSLFEPYRKDPAHRWALGPQDLLTLMNERPRLFPPGRGWFYSGSNYLILGLLVEETTGVRLRDELRRRILVPLRLDATDLPDAPTHAVDGLARGYLPPNNPLLPGPNAVDATELDLPYNWAGGGIVSTARDVARFLQALLSGELHPPHLHVEMLRTVVADWDESDAYGLGICEITSLMGKATSPCGAAWGHIGFSAGYTTVALASKSGERQAVLMCNGLVTTDEQWEAVGRLTWASYCR
jgi:D-alanyl-D-alanine carboxypeptidase